MTTKSSEARPVWGDDLAKIAKTVQQFGEMLRQIPRKAPPATGAQE